MEVGKRIGANTWPVEFNGKKWKVEAYGVGKKPTSKAAVMSVTARIYVEVGGSFTEVARVGPGWKEDKGLLVWLANGDGPHDSDVEALADGLSELEDDYPALAEAVSYGGAKKASAYSAAEMSEPLTRLQPLGAAGDEEEEGGAGGGGGDDSD